MKIIYFLLALTLSTSLLAQNIESTSTVLNFPSTTEVQTNSDTVIIVNPGIYPIEVTDVDLFSVYGNEPYFLNDTAFTVAPQDSFLLVVYFNPEHNIMHNLALIVKTKSGFGHVGVELKGQGAFANNYYSGTQNLKEEALKLALKSRLAQGYQQQSYNGARDNMYGSIDNVGGVVECVYTGRTATFNTRAGANSNSFNCEHTYPQSLFNENLPMKSDIHHLFSTDVSANSQRGNLPFGMVTNPSWTQGGSKKSGSTFEPRNAQKGPTARAMMYFVIRYQDYSNFFAGQETILRQWHNTYAPVTSEKTRNNGIYAVQNNRNPFVDYPQFEERITNFVSTSSEAANPSTYYSDDTIYLAKAAGRHDYHFVIYNDGNQNTSLTGFALSDTSLYFTGGNPSSVTLAPGEVLDLAISFNSETDYVNKLLSLSIDGQSISFPIYSGPSVIGVDEKLTSSGIKVYPNPVNDFFTLETSSPIKKLAIFDLSGRNLNVGYLNEKSQIDVSGFSKGIYFLKVVLEDGTTDVIRLVKN